MRPEERLDPSHVDRLRGMDPQDRLRRAFELNRLARALAQAGARHRDKTR